MKILCIFILMIISGFFSPVYSTTLSQVTMTEIIQTQIAFDAEITFGDHRYLRLEDYPNITQDAVIKFIHNPHRNMGPLFDCEDIAIAAQIRFILTLCKSLYKLNPNSLWHGAPVGTVTFGNSRTKHMINIIIYDEIAFMYDVGWKRFWSPEDIEDAGYWVMKISF